jgi:predicted nucleotidyltransferase
MVKRDLPRKYQSEIRKLTEVIAKEYKPEKIILFGSMARNQANEDSDIDMLIIKKTKKRKVERIGEVLNLVDYSFAFEPLILTPEELRERQNLSDFFILDILREGKVLYEAQP